MDWTWIGGGSLARVGVGIGIGEGFYIFDLASDGYEGAATGVETLRGRESDGEEGVGRTEDFEAGVCRGYSKLCPRGEGSCSLNIPAGSL